MIWIAPSEKDTDNAALEKRLWDAVDQLRANSGLKLQQDSTPVLRESAQAGWQMLMSHPIHLILSPGTRIVTRNDASRIGGGELIAVGAVAVIMDSSSRGGRLGNSS